MSRSEIIEKLADVIQMAMPGTELDASTLSEDANLVNDLGLSSVGVLYIVIAIEEFFNIRFDNVGFADFSTIGDVVDYIDQKLKA
jgi:acyl carrier protein